MRNDDCPDLEVLFAQLDEGRGEALEHATGCEHCAAILEEHRQLEKDLFRLADPLPPADFVQKVMAEVALHPSPRAEIQAGLGIWLVAIAACVVSLIALDVTPGFLGVKLAHALLMFRSFAFALADVVGTVWKVAAMPVTTALAGTLFVSLMMLRRLAQPATVKVS
jgi:anti-sigma factor RsiW